eukprot:15228290-Ditylum_brightwellii.AAC.1
METIAWDALCKILQHQYLPKQICLIKFVNNWLNIGEQCKKIKENALDMCPIFQGTLRRIDALIQVHSQ